MDSSAPSAPTYTEALTYPLQGSGLTIILVGALFFTVAGWLARVPLLGLFVLVFLSGYIAAYYFDIIASTVRGKSEPPNWPGLSDFWEDLLLPLFRVIGALILSFAPALISVFFFEEVGWWGVIPLVVLGCLYFPMAILAIVLHGHLGAALPQVVIPAILRCLPGYLLAAFLLIIVIALSDFIEALAARVPFVGGFIGTAVGLYFLLVQGRVVGVIYLKHQSDLEWD